MGTTKPSNPAMSVRVGRAGAARVALAMGVVVTGLVVAGGCASSGASPDGHGTEVDRGDGARKEREPSRSEVKLAAGCPTTVPAPWSACTTSDLVCDFTLMTSCRCELSNCNTPAGPTPGCTPSLGWRCRDDGCPWDMREACSNEGKRCAQDDGMCEYDYVCTDDAWKPAGGPSCRP